MADLSLRSLLLLAFVLDPLPFLPLFPSGDGEWLLALCRSHICLSLVCLLGEIPLVSVDDLLVLLPLEGDLLLFLIREPDYVNGSPCPRMEPTRTFHVIL